jgi:hypothetical protein
MRGRFDRYGFVLGLVMGVIIGVLTGSVAMWIGVGVVLGVAFSHRRFRKLRPNDVEILPPARMR